MVLAAGEQGIIELKGVEISEDTEFTLEVSGDVSLAQTKAVRFGPSVELVPLIEDFVQSGVTELPFSVRNTAEVSDIFNVQIGVWKDQAEIYHASRSYLLGVGEEVVDVVHIILAPGEYELRLSSLNNEISRTFAVVPQGLIYAEIKVERAQSGFLYIAGITNYRIFDLYGFLELQTNAFFRAEEANIPAMSTVQISGTFPASGHKHGQNALQLFVRDEQGELLASSTSIFEVRAPKVTVTAPSSLEFKAGSLLSIFVRLEAEGDLDALVHVEGKAGECSSNEIVFLSPHESKTSSLLCEVPEDSPSFEDYAVFHMLGLNETEVVPSVVVVPYSVSGKVVEIMATLDRKTYSISDSAVMTVSLRSKTGTFPALLRITHAGYAWETMLTLSEEWQTLDVRFQVLDFDSKAGYTVLDPATQKSLAIGFLNINEAFKDVSFWTDKDLYVAGERILVTARAPNDGELEFAIPDWGVTRKIGLNTDSPVVFEELVPKDAVSGVYRLYYRFGAGDQHMYFISVQGLRVTIKALELDRFQYDISGYGELTIVVHSNESIAATIHVARNVEGSYQALSTEEITLGRGFSTFVVPFSVGDKPGNGEVMLSISEGNRLVAFGTQKFQVGNIWLSLAVIVPTSGFEELPVAYYGTHLKEQGFLRLYVNQMLVLEDEIGSGWSYGKAQTEPKMLVDGLNEVLISVESEGQSLERRKIFQWKPPKDYVEQQNDVFYETLNKVEGTEAEKDGEPEPVEIAYTITEGTDDGVAIISKDTVETNDQKSGLIVTDTWNDERGFIMDKGLAKDTDTVRRARTGGGCNSSKSPANCLAVMCVALLGLATGVIHRRGNARSVKS